MDRPRQIALDILISWERDKSYPNLMLKSKLSQLPDVRERSFVTSLVYGVVESKLQLDYFIAGTSSIPLKKIHVVNLSVLRMGLYQMLKMNVPTSAACNTSVELAKKNGQFRSASFVNAILRKLASSLDSLVLPSGESVRERSITYSVDPSIIELFDKHYGKEFSTKYFESLARLEDNRTTVCVNLLKTDAETLTKQLQSEGALPEIITDGLIAIDYSADISLLPSFQQGLFHIIGKPSYETAQALDVADAQLVLDLCAAPGGKTFALAYQMKNKGKIIACDVHPHKIQLLEQQAKRLGITNIEFVCADATQICEKWIGQADRVLCDVPCSGLGIIGKKPDIRYKKPETSSLCAIQRKILENGMQYLKQNGTLVYSTCTVNPEENQTVSHHDQLEILKEKTFFPHIDACEGFYYAVMRWNKHD